MKGPGRGQDSGLSGSPANWSPATETGNGQTASCARTLRDQAPPFPLRWAETAAARAAFIVTSPVPPCLRQPGHAPFPFIFPTDQWDVSAEATPTPLPIKGVVPPSLAQSHGCAVTAGSYSAVVAGMALMWPRPYPPCPEMSEETRQMKLAAAKKKVKRAGSRLPDPARGLSYSRAVARVCAAPEAHGASPSAPLGVPPKSF